MSLEVSSLRALAHPTRLQMLSLLTGTELCAADVARELGISQANASYHLRQLAAAGEVVDAGEKHVRGGVAKLYRHPYESRNEDVGRTSGGDDANTRLYFETLAAELTRRSALRRRGQMSTTTDAELWVSPTEWATVVEATAAASLRLHRVAKPPRSTGTIRVSVTEALFVMTTDNPTTESAAAGEQATATERP